MNFFSIFLILLLHLAGADWILKIDSDVLPLQSFKDHVSFMQLQTGVGSEALADPEFVNSCYEDFINFRILLKESSKKSGKASMAAVQKVYEEQKESWIVNAYVTSVLPKVMVSEMDLRKYFDALKKSGKAAIPKTAGYDVLTAEEKQSLYQSLMLEKTSKEREKYNQELEKKYKVKRFGLKGVHCAVVGDVKISTASVRESIGRKIESMGATIEDLEKNKIEYQKYFDMELVEVIFRKMVEKEMQSKGYRNRADIKVAAEYLKKQILITLYIKKEIQEKIPVTGKEKDQEYALRKAQLEGRPFDEVNRYLEMFARERKSGQAVAQFLADKKEQYVIKRNRDLVKSFLQGSVK